jgi:nucleotide-binding universal stress UspA family protein
MFRRVLVGWDGSAGAGRALSAAVDLAAALGAEIVVLAVVPSPAHTKTTESRAAELDAAHRRMGEALADFRHDSAAAGVAIVDAVVAASDPGDALVAHAHEHGFDLLVVGRHGTAAVHPGVGKVTERVVRHATLPVLVVGE